MGPAQEKGAPSQKTMQYVKNRNNISRLNLLRRMEFLERENTLNITTIDLDRLDLWDFMRQIRKCASDELPESKHWLGTKSKRASLEKGTGESNIHTAASGEDSHLESLTDVRTTPADPDDTDEPGARAVTNVTIRARAQPESTRFEQKLARAGTSQTLVKFKPLAGEAGCRSARRRGGESGGVGDIRSPASDETDDASSDGRRHRLRIWRETTMARDERSRKPPSGAERSRNPPTGAERGVTQQGSESGNLMRHLLIENSKRFRRKKKRPIDDRIREFYGKVDDLKEPWTARSADDDVTNE